MTTPQRRRLILPNPKRFIFPLDIQPGATVALSSRVLSEAFLNNWIEQWRRADNDEVQIRPDLSLPNPMISLDSTLVGSNATLRSFLGSSSAFCSVKRNQTGGANFTQTIATSQPRTALNGVIETLNSVPCLTFDGVDDRLLLLNSDIYNGVNGISTICVYSYNNLEDRQRTYFSSIAAESGLLKHGIGRDFVDSRTGGRRVGSDFYNSVVGTRDTSPTIESFIQNYSTNWQVRINGSLQGLITPASTGAMSEAQNTDIAIGGTSPGGAGLFLNGKIAEIISYPVVINDSSLIALENNQKLIYLIP